MIPQEDIFQYIQNEIQKTLTPLFSTCVTSQDELEVIYMSITEVVLGEVILRVIQQVPEDQKKDIVELLNSGKTVEEKFQPLHIIAEENPAVVEAVTKYFAIDFPIFLSSLVETYLESATEEQREAFRRVANNTSADD